MNEIKDNHHPDEPIVMYLDPKTGELEERKKTPTQFVMVMDEQIRSAVMTLSLPSIKMLLYFIGNMRFDNQIKVSTSLNDLSRNLSIARRTASRSLNEMVRLGFLSFRVNSNKRTYYINPRLVRKGGFKRKIEVQFNKIPKNAMDYASGHGTDK